MENKEKRNYPIIDVPSDGKPKWYGGARTMAFVYSKHKGNFIVRGFSHEVEEFLKKNFTHYFFYFSIYGVNLLSGLKLTKLAVRSGWGFFCCPD